MESVQHIGSSFPCIKKERCCGCCACSEICPVKAIAMTEDAEGFLYPSIEEIKCIHCGLCRKVCPINGDDPL